MPVFKITRLENALLGVWKLSENAKELESLILDALDGDDLEKYKNFRSERRKKEWLATRILLQKIRNLELPEKISYTATCKPYVKKGFLGISHTREFVAVIFSEYLNVAVDVEKISERPLKIYHKFLTAEEINILGGLSEKAVTLAWTVKECVYKFYGKKQLPFKDGIKLLRIDYEREIINVLMKGKPIEVNFYVLENHFLSFCVEKVLHMKSLSYEI